MEAELARRISSLQISMFGVESKGAADPAKLAKCIMTQKKEEGIIFKDSEDQEHSKTTTIRQPIPEINNNNNINTSLPNEDDGKLVSLMSGDLIWLKTDDPSYHGMVLGSESLRSVAVEPEDTMASVSTRFTQGLFRICTGLNYRGQNRGGYD
jgi:hypothetical protein